jgi:hypothetical protein
MQMEFEPTPQKQIKMGLKSYFKPTPKLMRKLGDGLLAMSTMVSSSAIMTDHKWVALSSLLIGAIGKFMTNLFSEE